MSPPGRLGANIDRADVRRGFAEDSGANFGEGGPGSKSRLGQIILRAPRPKVLQKGVPEARLETVLPKPARVYLLDGPGEKIQG